MAHGFSAVKEMYLDSYAEVFAAAGFNALVFDNRNFGASDGEPRQEIDPWAQIRDYRHAITYATTLPEVDANRIGVWGSSYSGGHVLVVAASTAGSRRSCARCRWSMATRTSAPGARRTSSPDSGAVRRRPSGPLHGQAPAMVPVVAEDPLAPSALPTPDSYKWFTETHEMARRRGVTK